MPRRVCIFCGGAPTSNEHVIPRWAARVVEQDPRGVAPDSQHTRYLEVVGEPPVKLQEWGGNPIDFKANCVCAKCNGGWMGKIESDAQRFVAPMIQGKKNVTLDRDAQDIVATWLGLKAIVERYSRSPIIPIRREWVDYIYQNQHPPNTWQIRLGWWVGQHVAHIAGGDFEVQIRHTLVPFLIQRQAWLFTLGVGYFVGQVLGLDSQTDVPSDPLLFVQIWPHPLVRMVGSPTLSQDPLAWPPKRYLSDVDIERYSRDPMMPQG